jgi:OMF family outer membrane factor
MQPSSSLIAVGFGAVIALCSIEAAPAQIAPSVAPAASDLPEAAAQQPTTPEAPTAPTPDAAAPIEPSDAAPVPANPTPAIETDAERTPPEFSAPAAPETAAPDSTAPAAESAPAESTPGDAAPTTPTPNIPIPDAPSAPSPAVSEDASTLDLEYLDADPNPLQFPTRPEEVEVIGTQPITLQQALELAQRNSREIQQAQLELERSRAALRQARADELPTLDAAVSSTTQEVTQTSPSRFDPTTGEIDVGETDSSLETNLTGQLQLSYDLFTSGRRSATIRANERQVRFQELQLETVAEELRLNVTVDYYDMQEADEQVRIARVALEEALRNLQDAQAQERAGVGTRFAVLQAEVEVANSRQTLTQRLSDQRVARRQLVQRLGLGQSVDISASEPVEVVALWNLSLPESIVLAYRNRAELEQQLVQREISQAQRRVALSQTEPQVSVNAGYSVQNALGDDEGFTDNFSFGAQLNWRLFDGGAARANADQEEANIAIAETQFASTRDQVRFQVEQAYLNLQANFENIQTASLALEQATESLRLARLRFQAGVGTQLEVLESLTDLTEAELNRVQAILGYNRSLAQLRRAVSNLPDGDLAETP